MREILFRGKRIDNGKWVEGYYFCMHHNDSRTHIHHFIIPLNIDISKEKTIAELQVEVDPATVGEFTSLCDKNGKKIFEGDICKFIYWHPVIHKVITDISKIFFANGAFCTDGIYNDSPQTLDEWLFN